MTTAPAWRRALLKTAAWNALILAALWPVAAHMAGVWSSSDYYRYSWLVLPTFAYLALDPWRGKLRSLTPGDSLLGLALVLPAAGLWLAGEVSDINALQHLSLLLCVFAGFLFFLGPALCREALPLLCLLLLLFPNGDIMMPLLQPLTLFWVEAYAFLLQLPFEAEGFRIVIDGLRYIVNEECAGLPIFNLFLFLGFSFGLILYRDLPRVIATAAGFGVLAILSNALRVMTIVTIDRGRATQMDLAAHQDIQFVIVAVALVFLLAIVAKLPRAKTYQY